MPEEIPPMLERLSEIHKALTSQVDFASENRGRAIWYLQGAAISTAYALWSMYKTGLAVPASHEWRYVNEIRDLVTLFEHMEDGDRRIRAWYRGEVVERRRREPLPEMPGLPEEFYETETANRREHLDTLSKFVHPTIKVARYNASPYMGAEVFIYDWSYFEEFDELLIIVNTALICSIHSLLIPATTLPVSLEVRRELNTLFARVHGWSVEASPPSDTTPSVPSETQNQ